MCNIKIKHVCGCFISSIFILVALFVILLGVNGFPPTHASCKIDWTFEVPCNEVSGRLVKQMEAWQGRENCGEGQKCLYKVTEVTDARVSGTHTTPVKAYVDDLTYDFTQTDAGCNVHGFSTSETWYAVLDYGTNYCNLHNLIVGAELDKAAGYTEVTNGNICTQYASADCEKY